MLPGMELVGCQGLAVPAETMHHVVQVESSYRPFAIGVVGARLARQPASLDEAVATARMLEARGFNFSLGLAQVNRHNLASQGLASYHDAFDACRNVVAGSRILADCHRRAGGDWPKAFSCYYSGNFTTGFRDGYVDRVLTSIAARQGAGDAEVSAGAIAVVESRNGDEPRRARKSRRRADFDRQAVARPAVDVRGPTVAVASTDRAPEAGALPDTDVGNPGQTRDGRAPTTNDVGDTAFVF